MNAALSLQTTPLLDHDFGLPSIVEISSPVGFKKPLSLNTKLGAANQRRPNGLKIFP
jgi:hypothetical protein